MTRRPLFLERASFRRRRLGDAARVLPVIAALLLTMPVLWPSVMAGGAGAVVWLFGLWAGLILATLLLHRALIRAEAAGNAALIGQDAVTDAQDVTSAPVPAMIVQNRADAPPSQAIAAPTRQTGPAVSTPASPAPVQPAPTNTAPPHTATASRPAPPAMPPDTPVPHPPVPPSGPENAV